jgi:uncharacterized iron-regulated membrane protein
MRLPLRRVVFWAHLAVGAMVGLVVVMMSATGVVLTYEKQVARWADREQWVSGASSQEVAPLSTLIASAQRLDPDTPVSSLVFHADPSAPVEASLGRGRTVYLDPATARIRGERDPKVRAFFGAVRGWHRWFNLSGDARAVGRAVTGWSNLAFLFLIVSGRYLWVPRRRSLRHVRAVLLVRKGARGRARDFD